MAGLEPATPCSQSRCATKLRYIPGLLQPNPGCLDKQIDPAFEPCYRWVRRKVTSASTSASDNSRVGITPAPKPVTVKACGCRIDWVT
jgi:hypothetical protein